MILAGLAAAVCCAVLTYAACIAAGRADRAAEAARRAARAFDSAEIGELLLPWPGTELLAAVRREFPHLPDELVYSVAQARARLRRGAPGALG